MTIPFIIAELGSNPAAYDWNLDRFCSAAAGAGAAAVKVQLFRAEHFPAAEQSAKRRLEFPRNRVAELRQAAHSNRLKVGASVFDGPAIALTRMYLDFIKLAAREQDNTNLIAVVKEVIGNNLPVYRSVDRLGSVIPGWTHLYAVQRYPAGMIETLYRLLRAVSFWRMTKMTWGHSSHTRGILDCLVAARLGASVIEKHFCLTASDPEGPHSLDPLKFKQMVDRLCQSL